MEPLFEVSTCIDKTAYREVYWLLRLTGQKARAGFAARLVFSLLLCGGLIYLALQPAARGGMNIAIYLLIVLYWVMFALSARFFARNALKRNKRFLGVGELDVVIRFYDDRFEQDSLTSGKQYTVQLGEIVKVHASEHYYFVIVSDGYHCVAKDGFQIGAADEFVAYLTEHGVIVD